MFWLYCQEFDIFLFIGDIIWARDGQIRDTLFDENIIGQTDWQTVQRTIAWWLFYICSSHSPTQYNATALLCWFGHCNWVLELLVSYRHIVISPLGIIYTTDLLFPSVACFFIFLLALRSQNQRMDGLWVCYEQLEIWCNFNILWLDSLPHPPIFLEMENCPK